MHLVKIVYEIVYEIIAYEIIAYERRNSFDCEQHVLRVGACPVKL